MFPERERGRGEEEGGGGEEIYTLTHGKLGTYVIRYDYIDLVGHYAVVFCDQLIAMRFPIPFSPHLFRSEWEIKIER